MSTHIVTRGHGRPALFIHGSAADHTAWIFQIAALRRRMTVIAYDRESGDDAVADELGFTSVEAQARCAAELLEGTAVGRAAVIGSSFGGVVALELARRWPGLVARLVLCEPPLACSDDLPSVPTGFGCAFDRICAARGGAAAAELFLRAVLADEGFERMPATTRDLACARWRQIRSDMVALARYRVGYPTLSTTIRMPVMLLGGAHSESFFASTLESLHAALPGSRLHVVPGAGHMMQVDNHIEFNRLVADFVCDDDT